MRSARLARSRCPVKVACACASVGASGIGPRPPVALFQFFDCNSAHVPFSFSLLSISEKFNPSALAGNVAPASTCRDWSFLSGGRGRYDRSATRGCVEETMDPPVDPYRATSATMSSKKRVAQRRTASEGWRRGITAAHPIPHRSVTLPGRRSADDTTLRRGDPWCKISKWVREFVGRRVTETWGAGAGAPDAVPEDDNAERGIALTGFDLVRPGRGAGSRDGRERRGFIARKIRTVRGLCCQHQLRRGRTGGRRQGPAADETSRGRRRQLGSPPRQICRPTQKN